MKTDYKLYKDYAQYISVFKINKIFPGSFSKEFLELTRARFRIVRNQIRMYFTMKDMIIINTIIAKKLSKNIKRQNLDYE